MEDGPVRKFHDLGRKVDEVIEKGSEMRYLEFVFSMASHDLGLSGIEKEKLYNNFVNSYCDSYSEFRKRGFGSEEAKSNAIYKTTKKYLPGRDDSELNQ